MRENKAQREARERNRRGYLLLRGEPGDSRDALHELEIEALRCGDLEILADWIDRARWLEVVEGDKNCRKHTTLLDHSVDAIVVSLRSYSQLRSALHDIASLKVTGGAAANLAERTLQLTGGTGETAR